MLSGILLPFQSTLRLFFYYEQSMREFNYFSRCRGIRLIGRSSCELWQLQTLCPILDSLMPTNRGRNHLGQASSSARSQLLQELIASQSILFVEDNYSIGVTRKIFKDTYPIPSEFTGNSRYSSDLC